MSRHGDVQPGLFDAEPLRRPVPGRQSASDGGVGEPARKRTAGRRAAPKTARPQWSAYYGSENCGRCTLRAYRGEQDVARDPIRPALYRRRYAGDVLLLCAADARHYKDADGGGVLPSRRATR
jgi:hypothetical protein